MVVRQATKNDLKQVADVHIQCFPDSFSTQLGKSKGGYLQQQFYREYIDDVPELFLVAEEAGMIVGFCMGYYCEKNDYVKNFFKHNIFRIGLRILVLLISGNQQTWKKVKGIFIKEKPFKIVDQTISMRETTTGDLLSICVLPEFRGGSVAQSLIEEYMSRLKNKGRELCLLTVDLNNGRGIRFYERNGFIPYREKEGQARTYAKVI